MKKWLIVVMILFIVFSIMIFLVSKKYWVSNQDSYIPYTGSIDLYNASREELISLDLCNYSKAFGEVKNEKEASQIAAKVIKEVYKNDEYPYIVKLNETANAWIVHGSSGTCAGGVASIAIDRNNGEILMLIHTK